MTRKVLYLDSAVKYAKEEWEDVAKEFDVELVECTAKSSDELLSYFAKKDVVAVANTVFGLQKAGLKQYTPELISKLSEMGVQAVCNRGAGFDSLGPLEAWKEAKIQVSNTPNAVAPTTADTGAFLTIAAMRHFWALGNIVREHRPWSERSEWMGSDPRNQVLGILGMGNIGRMIRDRLKGFDFEEVWYFNRHQLSPDLEQGAKYASTLEMLLENIDVLIVAVPLSADTQHLINAERLSRTRRGVTIVNIARGAVIDENALVAALNDGHVAGVGLDVFEHEPQVHPGLIDHPSAFLLPHAATFTAKTREDAEREHLANIRSFLATGEVESPIFKL